MPIRSSLVALCLLSSVVFPSLAVADDDHERSSVTYYETLSPYGDWVVTESYGRVWRPHLRVVGDDFVPYASGGHWVHTHLGWVFEADWEWAWLPFHYGRWYQDDLNGWVWMPGDVWAPAWVEWRFGGGYIGWMPLGPPNHARPHWYFVESEHFSEHEIWRHRYSEANEHVAIQATVTIRPPTGIAFSAGPSVEVVRATSRVAITERRLDVPPPPLPRGVAVFPAGLPPAPPRAAPAAKSEALRGPQPALKGEDKAPGRPEAVRPAPVPQQAMPAPERRAEPVRPAPVPQQAMPTPARQPEPSRPTPAPQAPERRPEVPQQAMPATRPPEPVQRPRAEQPNPIREPSKPNQEPFRPMIEPNPQRREPTQAQPQPQRREPMQAQPQAQPQRREPMPAQPQAQPQQPAPAPVKRPQVQPQPNGPGPGPAPGRGPREPRH